MKKLVSVIILSIISLFVVVTPVLAQEMSPELSITPTASPSPTPVPYLLAYPGMLPDTPLYILKVLRDRISELLITSQDKKIAFYLLQADKQIGMIPLLLQKKEISIATTTALKGENNLTKITFLYKANGSKPSQDMYKKLLAASTKHQAILLGAESAVANDKEAAKIFDQVYHFSLTNENEIKNIYKGQQ